MSEHWTPSLVEGYSTGSVPGIRQYTLSIPVKLKYLSVEGKQHAVADSDGPDPKDVPGSWGRTRTSRMTYRWYRL